VQTVEMTMTHKHEIVYGTEVLDVIFFLREIIILLFHDPTRLVVIYMSPLPRLQLVRGDPKITESSEEGERLLDFPREPVWADGNNDQMEGIFIRPLEEGAFERHVKGLEFY
jgi:hypothetical protein